MTCIVGIEHDGAVWMGGDSSCNDAESDSIMVQREPKVFSRGPYLIGFSGSFRVGAILRYIADLPPVPKTGVERMMITEFSSELRRCFKAESMSEDEDWSDWHALVGIRGHLFCVESDFHVWRHREKYSSIGSGSMVALGALHAMAHEDLTPTQKIEVALEASAKYVASVRGPWTISTTKKPRKSKDPGKS